MSEWREVALGDVVSSLGGLWGEPEPTGEHVGVLALRGTDFDRARSRDLSSVPRRYVPPKALDRRRLDPNCIVIEASGGSKDQPVGRTLLVRRRILEQADRPLSAASFCKILRVDPLVACPRFVCGILENTYQSGEIEYFQSQSTGLRNLRTKQLLAHLRFQLPDLASQRRIAAVLSAFDELIEINERRIEVLEDLARSLYREWFVRFRFAGDEEVEFVDSELGLIPRGWRAPPASEVRQLNPRLSADQGLFPKVAMGDVDERWSHVLPSAKVERPTGSRFQQDDVLMARITPCLENGKTALVKFLQPNEVGVGSTEFAVLRGVRVGPAFVYCAARSDHLREHAVKSMSGASGRQRIASNCFDTVHVVEPGVAIADRFEATAGPMLQEVYERRVQNDALAATRELLLPRLVTGRLDISDIDLGELLTPEAA